jgi:hypothetical protein
MRKLIPILALAATAISAPAFAQPAHYAPHPAHYAPHRAPAVQSSSDAVTWRGSVRGQDPDWFIRYQILRDAEAAHT